MLVSRLASLSHDQRMSVFRLLMRRYPQCLPAGEIARILGLKSSTASVYLGALTRVGLIAQNRQGTSLLYKVVIDAAREVVDELFNGCCLGRPDMCSSDFGHAKDTARRKTNVLFVCTGNSARSIFAEALLTSIAGDHFNVYSAGTQPFAEPNPLALEILQDNDVDANGLRCKHLSEFQGQHARPMNFVFTVCDQAANEERPIWSGQPISAHWGLPDPVRVVGSDTERRRAFQNTFEHIRARITAFAELPLASLNRLTLQKKVDDIGQDMEII